jgi:hypothetical protein
VLILCEQTKIIKEPSGRQDLNLRPLDPQDVGVGIFTSQTGCKDRVPKGPTCVLFASAQDVWSQMVPRTKLRLLPCLPLVLAADLVAVLVSMVPEGHRAAT